jgi:hypothetical protein
MLNKLNVICDTSIEHNLIDILSLTLVSYTKVKAECMLPQLKYQFNDYNVTFLR